MIQVFFTLFVLDLNDELKTRSRLINDNTLDVEIDRRTTNKRFVNKTSISNFSLRTSRNLLNKREALDFATCYLFEIIVEFLFDDFSIDNKLLSRRRVVRIVSNETL